jgi:hypothetical protein
MLKTHVLVACAAVSVSSLAFAGEVKLPPEVTPALRAACESDVRRIGCVDATPTYSEVKSCVIGKYAQLGKRCKVELASAGYSGPSNVPKSGIKADSVKAASAKPVSIKTLFNW